MLKVKINVEWSCAFKTENVCKNASLPKQHLRTGRTREIIINIRCIEIRNLFLNSGIEDGKNLNKSLVDTFQNCQRKQLMPQIILEKRILAVRGL